MGVSKCVVCGYTYKGDEKTDLSGRFICPYCGTIKPEFNGREDFKRASIIASGYEYLSKSMIKEASMKFNDYVAKFGSDDPQVVLGEALLECRISNCLNYKNDDLITVVHQKSLLGLLDNDSFNVVIKEKNPKIYNNVRNLIDKESSINSLSNQVIILTLEDDKATILEDLISNYSSVIKVNILDTNIESIIYKNLFDSKALVIYVENRSMLRNEYFLSIYYRFKALKKNIVFVYNNIKLQEMYSDDISIDYNDNLLKDKLSNGILKKENKNNSDDFTISGTSITSIKGSDIVIPSNIVKIDSRSAYQSEVSRVVLTTTGSFKVSERAFDSSSIEAFLVESNKCELTIDKDAFRDARALKTLSFMNKDINLGTGAFRNCISLREVNFSLMNELSIPDHLFDGCQVLEDVLLPFNILKIGKYAFRDTLVKFTVINTDTVVDVDAFKDANNLEIIKVLKGKNEVIKSFNIPNKCKVVFEGKELKKAYKAFKKDLGKEFSIELTK